MAIEDPISAWFARQVDRSPDRVAVVYEGRQLTYRELDFRSNQFARHLRALGVGPEGVVGLCLERNDGALIAILGILKAGGAFVPLDPESPRDRNERILDLAGARIVVTCAALHDRFGGSTAVVDIDADAASIAGCSAAPVESGACSLSLAYVIFTSGSTGEPKGVTMQHDGILTRIVRTQKLHAIGSEDRVLQIGSLCFDISVWEIFVPLLAGGRVVIADQRRAMDFAYLTRLIRDEGVTVARFVPAVLKLLMEDQEIERCSSLRRIVTGGDTMSVRLMSSFLERSRIGLFNQYGPSERPSSISWECRPRANLTSVPIGRPHDGTEAYVLDRSGNLVPVGVIGELYIGGVGLARGYLHRPALTAERFLPNPFSGVPGARMYRTGDLVRYRPDGDLEFIGRKDFQVKIGGVRVELKEIEFHLQHYPGIKESAVVARDVAGAGKQLVACFVASAPIDPDDLRSALARNLPAPMIPAYFMQLDEMPLNRNGKIDRLALPSPTAAPSRSAADRVAPRDELERAIVDVFASVLGVEQLGALDNFFEAGGHSLKAIHATWRLQESLSLHIGVADIFSAPTAAALARRVRGRAPELGAVIRPLGDAAEFPLSPAQQRLWLLYVLDPASPAYNMGRAFRIQGDLSVDALRAAVDRIVARHETLRTQILDGVGGPVQRVLPAAAPVLDVLDPAAESARTADGTDRDVIACARAAALRVLTEPFLAGSGPLFRARLLRLGARDHVLVYAAHHLVADGWSMGLFLEELTGAYEAALEGNLAPPEPLRFQYKDYARWHSEMLAGPGADPHIDYWKSKLAAPLAPVDLPVDRPRSAAGTRVAARISRSLASDELKALKRLSDERASSAFVVLLSAIKVLLHRYTGQRDIVTGTVSTGRSQAAWREQIGFFVNTLALRDLVDEKDDFASVVRRVQATLTEAWEHEVVPFDRIVEELGLSWDRRRSPLFDVMVVYDEQERRRVRLPGLETSRFVDVPFACLFDLTFELRQSGDHVEADITYDAALFDEARIERMWGHLGRLLRSAAEAPRSAVRDLRILTDAEELALRAMSTGAPPPSEPGRGLLDLFDEQVDRRPDAPAVVSAEGVVTYRELRRRADDLAAALEQRCRIQPEDRIAVVIDRSASLVTALVGVVAAGGAYVPIDPAYPDARIAVILRDSGVKAVVTEAAHVPRLLSLGHEATPLIAIGDVPPAHRSPRPCERDRQLAYVIYTSGSTGRPKGVMVERRSLRNLVQWHVRAFGITERSRAMMYAGVGFDASTWEIWPYLLTGAALYPVHGETRLDPRKLAAFAHEHRLDIGYLPTSVCDQLVAHDVKLPPNMRILTGGEALSRLGSRALRVVNNYGPTECTVVATSIDLGREAWERPPPIGAPIDGVGVLVLDPGGEPCPVGIEGEIHLSGVGLARGYLGSPDLTAERFVPHPQNPGQRLYRTGDRGRWRDDGSLEFFGRRDEQIKLRGVRIELGEVTRAVADQPGVKDARVLLVRPPDGEGRLVAFVAADAALDVARVAAGVRRLLPAESVPSSIHVLDQLPLTPNGKVDFRALLALGEPALTSAEFEPPLTELERRLAALWCRLLGVPRVGLGTSFLELGGNSITAMRMAVELDRELGLRAPLTQIFATPVLRDFAHALERARGEKGILAPSLMRLSSRGPRKVFCMPSIFGHAGVFARLAERVRASSFEGFDASESAVSPAAYADVILRAQPDGDIVLLGYSAGGNMAFSVAQEIERRGGRVESLLLLDSSFRETPRSLSDAALDERCEAILRATDGASGPPPDGEDAAWLRRRVTELLRDHYSGTDTGRVASSIHFVRAVDTPPGRARRWAEATSRRFTEHQGAGGHFEMLHGASAAANAALIETILLGLSPAARGTG